MGKTLIDVTSLDLTDLPDMGKSETDHSDPKQFDAAGPSLNSKDGEARNESAELRKDDELGLQPLNMDDLSALPAMPAIADHIAGLPQKHLGLDM